MCLSLTAPLFDRVRLTVNFIVPWGNFQTFFFRPDADDGPFCSSHTNRPSERSWREFMEGTTVRLVLTSTVVNICPRRSQTSFASCLECCSATGVSQQAFQTRPTCMHWAVGGQETRGIDSSPHRHQGPRVLPWFYS